MAIKGSSRQHSWVSGTPLDVKTPLSTGGQLIQDLIEKTSQVTPHNIFTTVFITRLNSHLSRVGVPAQDPVIFPAAQEQLWICFTPGYGQNTPEGRHIDR